MEADVLPETVNVYGLWRPVMDTGGLMEMEVWIEILLPSPLLISTSASQRGVIMHNLGIDHINECYCVHVVSAFFSF